MKPLVMVGLYAALLLSQGGSGAVIAHLATAKWVHDAGDPPGSENVMLREDPKTGGMELLVRYPAGHTFNPHWHSANERLILLEGKLSLGGGKFLEPGGYAYLPAKEVQRLSCVSTTRCTMYIHWDSKLDFHPAK